MKTPMQELMDEFAKKADSLPNTLDANAAYLVFQECYDMAEAMLEKEKEVISSAFHADRPLLSCYEDGRAFGEYYNETFNSK